MKTIEELSQKPWYRLLKVFYIIMWLPFPFMLYILGTSTEGPIKSCIIMTALYVLFTEGTRRAFYYVLIGTLFPGKKASVQACKISEGQQAISTSPEPRLMAKLRTILKLNVGSQGDEDDAERVLEKRQRRKWSIAIIVGCSIIIVSYIGIYKYFTGFSWKEYRFRNGDLTISLPFEPKKDPQNSSPDERFAPGQEEYKASSGVLHVHIAYRELKPGYKFVVKDACYGILSALSTAEKLEVVTQKYEGVEVSGYSAGKMIVDLVLKDFEGTMEIIFILVDEDKSWCIWNMYERGNSRQKEASGRIFSSIRIR